MSKIVVIGVGGMLGRDLELLAQAEGVEVHGLDLPGFDLTQPAHVAALPPADWVVNCAALTDVDGAESRREVAMAVNAAGPALLAKHCAARRVPLLHISTDYVFDGTKGSPYTEDDMPHPLNVYGESKLGGERGVIEAGGEHLVVRTQSLFGVHGRNFVRAICDRIDSGQPLRVVVDQVSSPTYTRHLAQALLRLMAGGHRGLVNVAATGACSWHAFAVAIAARWKPGTPVATLTTAELARPARRPALSVLDTARYRAWTGLAMSSWDDGLDAYLAALREARRNEGGGRT